MDTGDIFAREKLLIGEEKFHEAAEKCVLIAGLGGVGGACMQSLVRAGIHNFILIDGDVVLLNLHFGQGLVGEIPPGAAMLAPGLINESGTGAMSREQLQEVLAGTSLSLDFAVTAESFSFRGSCLSSELERMLQVLHARLHDPGFRPEAFTRVREQLEQMM